MYEKTQGAETNRYIVRVNILLGSILGLILAFLLFGDLCDIIRGLPDPFKTTPFFRIPLLLTLLFMVDRACWQNYHLNYKEWAVTDDPSAYSFERITAFVLVCFALVSFTKGGPWKDFIEQETLPTVLYALSTAPILQLLSSGWKTLKATPREGGEEVTWTPYFSTILAHVVRLLHAVAQFLRNKNSNHKGSSETE